MFEKLTSLLDSMLEWSPYYDCIVLQNGKCIYRHSNGFKDEEKTQRVAGNERYNIYSCSKMITCVAAMQLYEKGMFSLEDKLSKYLPEFETMYVKTADGGKKKAQNPILIKHLFTMTAGFDYSISRESVQELKEKTNGACPTREAVKLFAQKVLDFEPGEGWRYSFCHDILACLVEVISGMRFGEYVKKNIFDVAGMKNSTFMLPENELDTLAPQYKFNTLTGKAERISGRVESTFAFSTKYESGGAGCISTLEDYIKFEEVLREGEALLKRDTLRLMTTNRLSGKSLEMFQKSYTGGYGLGVRCGKTEGSCLDGAEFGWGGKAGAAHSIDVKNGISVYCAQHMINYPPEIARRKGRIYKTVTEDLGL